LKFDALVLLLRLLMLLLRLLGLSVAGLFVDMNFLAMLLGLLGTTETLFFVDADLLLDVSVAVVGSVDGGGEGFVGFFVTFPSV
jgi:hypothetical protein